MQDVDIVFHAAALKHVPLCEYNLFEAVSTNIQGTQNLINVARAENVDKFKMIFMRIFPEDTVWLLPLYLRLGFIHPLYK